MKKDLRKRYQQTLNIEICECKLIIISCYVFLAETTFGLRKMFLKCSFTTKLMNFTNHR